jgi:hypothetical protein
MWMNTLNVVLCAYYVIRMHLSVVGVGNNVSSSRFDSRPASPCSSLVAAVLGSILAPAAALVCNRIGIWRAIYSSLPMITSCMTLHCIHVLLLDGCSE